MRKNIIYFILLIFLLTICGCSDTKNQASTITINLPSDDSVNGYRISEPQPNITDGMPDIIADDNVFVENNSNKKQKYYANTKSKKFHLKSCIYATKLDEENLFITSDRNSLISQNYSPCKKCEP